MEPSYNAFADMLAKFQSSPEWIKALWMIAPMLTVLGIAYLATQVLRDVLRLRKVESPQPESGQGVLDGHLLYGIYRNAQGELVLYRYGKTESLSADDLPPPLKMLQ
jgi:hypothetical protein